MAKTGSEIAKELLAAKPDAWQPIILQHALEGDVPSWVSLVAGWPWVTVKATIDGKERALSYQVLGNYYALGTDADPLIVPFIPASAQQIADRASAIMVTRKMVSDIERGPSNLVRLTYETLPLPNVAPASWIKSNAAIWKKTPKGLEGIVVNGGAKKNVVIGPNLKGDRIAIFGAFNGVPTADGNVKPPYVISPSDAAGPFTQGYNSTFHEAAYFDHSHGVRFARRQALLDGQVVDLRAIMRDPKLHVLLSDQGPFDARFPNSTVGIKPASTTGQEEDDQGYAPIAEDLIPQPSGFPWAPVIVGAVAVGLVVGTLASGPSRA
jgi:hypothetical protein